MPKKTIYRVVYNACYGGFGLSNEAIDWLIANGSKHVELWESPILGSKGSWEGPRHDKLLVKCVKTLGENANGPYSDLKVYTLKSPLYIVDEYDGAESVQEPDSMDWIDASKEEEPQTPEQTFYYTIGKSKKVRSLVASDEKSFWEAVASTHPGKKVNLGIDVAIPARINK